MTNMFFLSPEMNFRIIHLKVTAKFDNANKGKLRLAIRVMLETTKEIKEGLRFLLLVKNEKKQLKIEQVEERYNKLLLDPNFRVAAGLADRFTGWEDKREYTLFKITESFKEHDELSGRDALLPKSLKCESTPTMDLPENLRKNISKEDIVLEIEPKISSIKPSTLLAFQFAFVLDKFVDEDTLSRWASSGKVWSVNFDFHERIGYENLFKAFQSFFTYPETFELWIYIPKGHYPIASSPHYKKAFKLGAVETHYRVTEEEFETDEGDIAVQIMNRSGEPELFSIICISPYVGEEQLKETEEKIEFIRNHPLREIEERFGEVEEKLEEIPSWRDFLQNMVLTVALFSLLIGAIVILAQQAFQGASSQFPVERPQWQDAKAYLSSNFALLIEISVFMGFSLWGVYASLKIITEKYGGFELLAYVGLVFLGSLGILSQIFGEQYFLKISIILISSLFIIFGLAAFIIRVSRR